MLKMFLYIRSYAKNTGSLSLRASAGCEAISLKNAKKLEIASSPIALRGVLAMTKCVSRVYNKIYFCLFFSAFFLHAIISGQVLG